jgi:PAS domain S-box-containing protein
VLNGIDSRGSARHYVIAAVMVAAAVGLRLALDPILGRHSPFLFFPIAILLAARYEGWWPGFLAAVLSTLAGWYFLLGPPFSWTIADKANAENLAVLAISGAVISLLGSQLRTTLISKARSERAARESEAAVRALLDSAAQAILAVDTAGKIVMANGMTETVFGYMQNEILGQPFDLLLPEESRGRHRECHEPHFADPRRRMGTGFDLKARRKDGAIFPVEISLSHIETAAGALAIAFVTDITERTRVEEERQRFVSLADTSPEFIGMCDLDFKPFYINKAGMRLVGHDNPEAAYGVKVQDYYFPEDQPFIINEFLPRVMREGHGQTEIRFRHFKTREPIWMLHNVFRICDNCAVTGLATVSIDVTERRRAEHLAGRLLINAEEEARRQISRELHDDLSQKLAMLSFDCSSLLLARSPSLEQMKQELHNFQTRVVQISQDVRQLAHQLHPAILEDLGISAALRELCNEFSARDGIEAVFEEENLPKDVPVDIASCLYRVAQEALHNVSKYARASHVSMTLIGSDKAIHLCIIDNGVGFDPEAESFRHGLGFISMQERVRLAHGRFSVHSQPGWGTGIKVFIPLTREMV